MDTSFQQSVKTDWGEAIVRIVKTDASLTASVTIDQTKIKEWTKDWDDSLPEKGQIHGLKKQVLEALKRDEEVRRRLKLYALRQTGSAYPNHFQRIDRCADIIDKFGNLDQQTLNEQVHQVTIAGRLFQQRIMGKVSFANIEDGGSSLQLYLSRDGMAQGQYQQFKQMDAGDIIGVSGQLFATDIGVMTVHVKDIQLLSKSLRSLPNKYHGLQDIELRYRRRYVDLMVNETSRQIFQKRSAIISYIRTFFNQRAFLEVETPMMHAIPGGAIAKPFVTHHNALDMDLYLRIAPELYLKKLIVGGLDRVYEINRNFRNEGLSTRHNPEFTMIEFYQAYATYHDLMDTTEMLLRELADHVLGEQFFEWDQKYIDFSPKFARLTMKQSIIKACASLTEKNVDDDDVLTQVLKTLEVKVAADWGVGKKQTEIFEHLVEDSLIQPTFITEYPAEVSPLARRNNDNPAITDRFELFIGGREIANGFSELNDPEDQAQRFRDQVRARDGGDAEAMYYDEDYIMALEYGMPPTAGEGIGIDRLVMLLTNVTSIRDVLLFPLMRHDTQQS